MSGIVAILRTAILLVAASATVASAVDVVDREANSLALQRARAESIRDRAARVYYPPSFDLSALPVYQPTPGLSGTIRQMGSNYLADSRLEQYFEEAFHRYQPNIRFENNLTSTFVGMAGLYTDRADLAPMGRRPTWDELQAYQRVMNSLPAEIPMATGSYDVNGWTFALVVFVHRDNPLRGLTLQQLDGIFGAERMGGWVGNDWDASAARGAEKNIRTWGQLGLAGRWANKPIHVYGYNLNYHFPRDFAEKVMGGGYKWNEKLREYTNVTRSVDGKRKLYSAGEQLTAALADDPYGITYTCILYRNEKVKPLALATSAGKPYVEVSLHSVQDRSYPLAREVYYYAPRRPGEGLNPLVREYLRFVLSREGQEAVQRDGKYLPLTADVVREHLRKLDDTGKSARVDE